MTLSNGQALAGAIPTLVPLWEAADPPDPPRDPPPEDEELTGFATMIEDNLALPFETAVLGVTVTVRKIDYTDSGIVAICARGKQRQAIPHPRPAIAGPAPAGHRVDRRLSPPGSIETASMRGPAVPRT